MTHTDEPVVRVRERESLTKQMRRDSGLMRLMTFDLCMFQREA